MIVHAWNKDPAKCIEIAINPYIRNFPSLLKS